MAPKGKKGDTGPADMRALSVRRLKDENELLRGLANLLPEAIIIKDSTGGGVFGIEAVKVLCGGVSPQTIDEACRRAFGGLLGDLLADRVAAARDAAEIFIDEIHERGFNIALASRRMGDADTALRLWAWTDLTELYKRPEKGRERRHLEAVNMFTTGIAHNFNNLLGGISGAIDILEQISGADTRAQRCVGMTRRCVDDAIALTKKMSAAHRPAHEAAAQSAIEDVIKSVVEVQDVLQSGRIAFELAIPADLPPISMGWDALVRVIQNLIINGVEAIPERGAVKISARRVPDAAFVAVTIQDNGVGMSEETLQRVYEPFFSTKSIDQRNGVAVDGSGLGLWNVYQALKLAGGDISMVSRVGEGTVVEVMLPAAS